MLERNILFCLAVLRDPVHRRSRRGIVCPIVHDIVGEVEARRPGECFVVVVRHGQGVVINLFSRTNSEGSRSFDCGCSSQSQWHGVSNLTPNTQDNQKKKQQPIHQNIFDTKPLDPLYCTDKSHHLTIYRTTELSLGLMRMETVKPCWWSKSIHPASTSTPQTTTATGARTISTTLNRALRRLEGSIAP